MNVDQTLSVRYFSKRNSTRHPTVVSNECRSNSESEIFQQEELYPASDSGFQWMSIKLWVWWYFSKRNSTRHPTVVSNECRSNSESEIFQQEELYLASDRRFSMNVDQTLRVRYFSKRNPTRHPTGSFQWMSNFMEKRQTQHFRAPKNLEVNIWTCANLFISTCGTTFFFFFFQVFFRWHYFFLKPLLESMVTITTLIAQWFLLISKHNNYINHKEK